MAEATAPAVEQHCPQCQRKLRLPAAAAGRKARCPACGETFRVPERKRSTPRPPTPAGGDPIRFDCDRCGAHIKMPPGAAGRRARCPKCRNVLTIPAPDAPPDEHGLDDGFDLLDDLASGEPAAPAAPAPAPASACPACNAPMSASAQLCVSCGHNRSTGRKHAGASLGAIGSGAAGAALGGLRLAANPLLIGCLLSLAGATIGAVVWTMVAWQTGYEIGWIAWGLGALAGAGMYLGWRDGSGTSGAIAAGFAVLGIFGAKIAIFAMLISSFATGDVSSAVMQRNLLAELIADRALTERDVYDDEDREAQWDAEYELATARVEEMSDDEVQSRWEELHADLNFDLPPEQWAKVHRLAGHAADLRADAEGFGPCSEQRFAFRQEEVEKIKRTPERELDKRLAALDAWKADARWSDETYVRNRLAWAHAAQTLREEHGTDADLCAVGSSEWSRTFDRSAERVEALAHDERVAELRTLEAADRRREEIQRLAAHRAHVEARLRGYSALDDRNDELLDVEREKAAALDDEQLAAAVAAMDAWNDGGKWADPEYVRAELIYTMADAAVNEEAERSDANWGDVIEENWDRLHASARNRVDGIPPGEHRSRIERIHAEQRAEAERLQAEWEAQAVNEAAGALGGAFFATMFGLWDVLFGALALITAYRVGSSGFGTGG